MIATIFGTWHDSWAVVACAKFCCDMITTNWKRAKWNIHRIWIVMEKLLVKWAPDPQPTLFDISFPKGRQNEKFPLNINLNSFFFQENSLENDGMIWDSICLGRHEVMSFSASANCGKALLCHQGPFRLIVYLPQDWPILHWIFYLIMVCQQYN